MKAYALLLSISAILLICSCSNDLCTGMNKHNGRVELSGFSLECFAGVQVKEQLAFDFYLYKFIENKKVFLQAYLGCNPGLHGDVKEEYPDKKELINGLSYKYYFTKDTDGRELKQVLIESSKYAGEYLHFWYFPDELSPEQEQIALDIIHSLKMRE